MSNYQFATSFHERIKDKLLSRNMFEGIPEWMCNNLRLKGRPWSFKDHEFQKEIVGSNANDLCVIKSSQVGLTESTFRMILCFLAMQEESTAIFVLPHNNLIPKFSRARVDTMINTSPKLREMVGSGANSAYLKMIGSSALYLTGASTDASAISIPANIVGMDEFDFGDQDILSKFESRLTHNKDGGYRRRFSTPTVSGYGISAQYDLSTQARYFCKCEHCENWVAPDIKKDIIIPGYSNEFIFFRKDDLKNPNYRVMDSYIQCPKCFKSLDDSLKNPNRRKWIHAFPERAKKGYAVKPFDVAEYNLAPKIISGLSQYRKHEDYVNFALGETVSSALNQINAEIVKNSTFLIGDDASDGCFMGVDVGRTLNVTIGKRVNGQYVVKHFCRIDAREEDASKKIVELFEKYGCLLLVVDIGPDFTLCKQLSEALPGSVYFCQYISQSKTQKDFFRLEANPRIPEAVSVLRTECIDLVVKEINGSNFIFPGCEEMDLVEKHFQGMKRISGDLSSETGEENSPRWIKVGDEEDHYFHSTIYMFLAIAITGADELGYVSIALTGISSVALNTGTEQNLSVLQRINERLMTR